MYTCIFVCILVSILLYLYVYLCAKIDIVQCTIYSLSHKHYIYIFDMSVSQNINHLYVLQTWGRRIKAEQKLNKGKVSFAFTTRTPL